MRAAYLPACLSFPGLFYLYCVCNEMSIECACASGCIQCVVLCVIQFFCKKLFSNQRGIKKYTKGNFLRLLQREVQNALEMRLGQTVTFVNPELPFSMICSNLMRHFTDPKSKKKNPSFGEKKGFKIFTVLNKSRC